MQLLASNIYASRLLGVDSGMNEVSQNLSAYISGTTNRLTVTDNGAGGVTLDVSSSLGIAWSAITSKPTTLDGFGITGGTLSANLTFSSATGQIGTNTADGSDNKLLGISSAGATGITRGASIVMRGNEYPDGDAGKMKLYAQNGILIYTGSSSKLSSIDASGNLLLSGGINLAGGITLGDNLIGSDGYFTSLTASDNLYVGNHGSFGESVEITDLGSGILLTMGGFNINYEGVDGNVYFNLTDWTTNALWLNAPYIKVGGILSGEPGMTIEGDVYFTGTISTVDGTGSSAWDYVANEYSTHSDDFAYLYSIPKERYYLPNDGTSSLNIPVVSGKTYYVQFKGHGTGGSGSSSVTFTPPDFSTFRSGFYSVRYADGGLLLDEFLSSAVVATYDDSWYRGEFIFTAGTSGNLAVLYENEHTRTYIMIREIQH